MHLVDLYKILAFWLGPGQSSLKQVGETTQANHKKKNPVNQSMKRIGLSVLAFSITI